MPMRPGELADKRDQMRVVMVGPFGLRPKMTMARRALPMARALAERGLDIRLVLPPWDCPADSGKGWQDGRLHIVNVTLPALPPSLAHLTLVARMLSVTLAFSPDVVHCYKPKGHSGLVALLLWMLQRMRLWHGRLVVDSDDWEGEGGWNDVVKYSAVQRRVFAWQESWGLRHCDGVTVASRYLQQCVQELRGDASGVWYVPNGVDVLDVPGGSEGENEEIRGEPHPPDRRPHALLYTRFVEHGVEEILPIWSAVLEQVPRAKLSVVGDGLRGEADALRHSVTESGLNGSVSVLGWMEAEELTHIFRETDVVIMPVDDTVVSRAKSPARVLDVMAAGLPVVAHAVGEYAVLVDHMHTGLLASPGDAGSFVRSVVRLLSDPRYARALGRGAIEHARAEHAWSLRVPPLLDAYGAGSSPTSGTGMDAS